MNNAVLVINCGSSSVKFSLLRAEEPHARLWSGAVERIGLANAALQARDANGATQEIRCDVTDHAAALALILDAVEKHVPAPQLVAAGHRVVHGGPNCDCPTLMTAAEEARLRALIPLAPLHQPHNLVGIAALRRARPELPQVACFDTSFHHDLPRLAQLTGLPRTYASEGIRRYGFHGLSYEYIVDQLHRDGVALERERILVAHLGNGASLCAIRKGRSVDTSLGFSTLAGLPMGTRCGDLDPGIVLYLLGERGMSLERVQRLLYQESGLLGISGSSRNMQDLLDRPDDPAAAEAVDYFCYQVRRQLAALTAALGGLDRLVFTGGIGANAPLVRSKICAGLDYLGVGLDTRRNAAGKRDIAAGTVAIDVMATDEELVIARHLRRVLTKSVTEALA
ncbi:MAG: acetate/propionate family kinase [Gammaproteobacteria bacterium]|nr:acetate/propionate family kinase [Gammaproteobacteria bacterium]